MISFFDATPEMLGQLDTREAVECFRDLLWCHARRTGISVTKINISSNITAADGGIDASINTDEIKGTDELFITGKTFYQIKAGRSAKPWQESWLRKELFGSSKAKIEKTNLGEMVIQCLENNGCYVQVCFGISPTSGQVGTAEKHIKDYFSKCGYPDAQVLVWGQDHIVGLMAVYPSLCLKIAGRKNFPFQWYASWAMDSDMRGSIHLGDEQKEFIDNIRKAIEDDKIGHVRVIGEPGLGKTRLVLEAVSRQDLAAVVVYIRHGENFQKSQLYNELVQADANFFVILVIDECSSKERASIWNVLKGRTENCMIITIDHGPEQSRDEQMVLLDCPKLGDEQIEFIIQEYISCKNEARRWAEFCDGSPRVAHAIGENLQRNPEDILKPLATVDIWGRFVAGYDDIDSPSALQKKIVLRYVALFERFGFELPVQEEAEFIAKLIEEADPTITYAKFQSIVHELKERRIIQGKTTLFIVPKALHIYLWLEFWENYKQSFSLNDILPELPEGLVKWFIDMFPYAHNSEVATKQVSLLLGVNGLFADEAFVRSSIGCRFLNVLAEASPLETLSCMERTIGQWSHDQLLGFEDKDGRQYIVLALEKIAIWPELFSRAANMLLKLGEAENSSDGNNASGIYMQLYSLGYGPMASTGATPEQRLPSLQSALESDSVEKRQLALKACKTVLATYHGARDVGPEYQGLRPVAKLWTPKLRGEVFKAYKAVWELVVECWNKWQGEDRAGASNVLIESASGLIKIESLSEMVFETLDELVQDNTTDLSRVVSFITGKLRLGQDELPKEMIARLKKLDKEITGTNFDMRLRRYVLLSNWDDDFDDETEGHNALDGKIESLAEESIGKPEQLINILDKIVCGENWHVGVFGHKLCKADMKRMFLEKIIAVQHNNIDSATTIFLGGYLRGVFENNADKWEGIITNLLSDTTFDKTIVEIVWRSGLTDKIVVKLLEATDAERINITQFQPLVFSREIRRISKDNVIALLRRLVVAEDASAITIGIELIEQYYCNKNEKRELPEKLTMDLLCSNVPSKFRRGAIGFHWGIIARQYIDQHGERAIDLFSSLLRYCVDPTCFFFSSYEEPYCVINTIIQSAPEKCWVVIIGKLEDLHTEIAHGIMHWLGQPLSFGRKRGVVPISLFPINLVLTWVAENSNERAPYMARIVPPTLDSELTKEMLVQYGNLDDVRSSLYFSFYSGGWSGNESDYLRKKRDEARSWLKGEKSPYVICWLEEYIDSLSKKIERAEIWEERGF